MDMIISNGVHYTGHQGRLWVTRHPDGRITVAVAEPRILISDCLLDEIRAGEFPNITLVGSLLRVDAENRVVIYRITDKVPDLLAHYAEWPD